MVAIGTSPEVFLTQVVCPIGCIGNIFSEHRGNTFGHLRGRTLPWKELSKMDGRMRLVAGQKGPDL